MDSLQLATVHNKISKPAKEPDNRARFIQELETTMEPKGQWILDSCPGGQKHDSRRILVLLHVYKLLDKPLFGNALAISTS